MTQGRWAMLCAGLAAALMRACGGSVETGGSGGHGSTSSSGSGNGNGSTSGSTSSGAGGGAPCGGFGGLTCGASEYCDYFDDLCGANDGNGVCRPRPMACDKVYSPVCACDGKVYGNACEASSAGVDIANGGGCPAPAGNFACGAQFCALTTQYCRHTPSDVGGAPDSNVCVMAPAACGNKPSCACLAGQPCVNMCAAGPSGGVTITCPGG